MRLDNYVWAMETWVPLKQAQSQFALDTHKIDWQNCALWSTLPLQELLSSNQHFRPLWNKIEISTLRGCRYGCQISKVREFMQIRIKLSYLWFSWPQFVSTDRHRRKRISVRRDENLGRSKTTARVSFASPVKNHNGRSISHSRREPEMSKSNSRREPGRSTSKGKREPGRGLSNSRRKPGRSTSNSRREPGRSTSNSKREPGRSSSGVRLQESRIDVVDVTSSSRYLLQG